MRKRILGSIAAGLATLTVTMLVYVGGARIADIGLSEGGYSFATFLSCVLGVVVALVIGLYEDPKRHG